MIEALGVQEGILTQWWNLFAQHFVHRKTNQSTILHHIPFRELPLLHFQSVPLKTLVHAPRSPPDLTKLKQAHWNKEDRRPPLLLPLFPSVMVYLWLSSTKNQIKVRICARFDFGQFSKVHEVCKIKLSLYIETRTSFVARNSHTTCRTELGIFVFSCKL